MRILVVSNLYPPVVKGGYEVECAGAVSALRDRGDEVLVLTSSHGARSVDAEPGVSRRLPLLPESAVGQLTAPALATVGSAIAARTLERFQPDLVYIWNGVGIPHAALQRIVTSGTPTAFRVCEQWFAGLFTRDLFMRYLRGNDTGHRATWAALARGVNLLPFNRYSPSVEANVAIAWVSEFLRTSVAVPEGLRPVFERTILATPRHPEELIDLPRLESRPRRVIGFLGRLEPEKGVDVLIGAVGRLVAEGLDVEAVIAGGGGDADRVRLERLATDHGVLDRCNFVGWLSKPEVLELLGRASVLAVPSVWDEPLTHVVTEGALARVPVVASRIGGIPELLRADDEILLVPPADADALAAAIRKTLEDPEATALRVARAFDRARSLPWTGYVEATYEFVDEAYRTLTETGRQPLAAPRTSRSSAGDTARAASSNNG
jgi:glycogen synthase